MDRYPPNLTIFFRVTSLSQGNHMILPVPEKQHWRIWVKSVHTSTKTKNIYNKKKIMKIVIITVTILIVIRKQNKTLYISYGKYCIFISTCLDTIILCRSCELCAILYPAHGAVSLWLVQGCVQGLVIAIFMIVWLWMACMGQKWLPCGQPAFNIVCLPTG